VRNNPTKVWQKRRVDKAKQLSEPMDLGQEELHDGFEELDAYEGDPITRLPAYIHPWKGKVKVTRDPDSGKFAISMRLLLEEVVFECVLLLRIPVLKLEDWDLPIHEKFPHFPTNKCMTKIYYEVIRFTRLELMKWVKGVEQDVLLHILCVPHFHRSIINIVCLLKFLVLVHDGCLWLGEPIPIIDMLIHKITNFPYKWMDPAKEFGGKSKEKEIADKIKTKFQLVKN